ncbi:MAG: hypothetical protein KZQ90_09300 [Candidatus Thiodiazotropha sp. (ex Codakia rugifera)]|nr:hypothetical protein [Candidatus Thiodiazotropha sp. (ex Codakia rugifera)]
MIVTMNRDGSVWKLNHLILEVNANAWFKGHGERQISMFLLINMNAIGDARPTVAGLCEDAN